MHCQNPSEYGPASFRVGNCSAMIDPTAAEQIVFAIYIHVQPRESDAEVSRQTESRFRSAVRLLNFSIL
jgi:hypothetical protein